MFSFQITLSQCFSKHILFRISKKKLRGVASWQIFLFEKQWQRPRFQKGSGPFIYYPQSVRQIMSLGIRGEKLWENMDMNLNGQLEKPHSLIWFFLLLLGYMDVHTHTQNVSNLMLTFFFFQLDLCVYFTNREDKLFILPKDLLKQAKGKRVYQLHHKVGKAMVFLQSILFYCPLAKQVSQIAQTKKALLLSSVLGQRLKKGTKI